MGSLTFHLERLDLPLVHPFTIARGSEDVAKTAVMRLQWNGIEAIGEAAPIARYKESVDSVIEYFQKNGFASDDPYLFDTLLDAVPTPAARCLLDLALYDLLGKTCGKPLYQILGVDPAKTPYTSFTIGIGDPELTAKKVADIVDHPIMKVKLGIGTAKEQIATIEAIRSQYTGTIRIDANEGWNVDTAVEILREIARFDIEFCEQPIPAGHPEQLRHIRESVKIPIVTDEDSLVAEDLPKLYGCVDGINVKLVKCGGIRAALKMIHTARALGLKIMLGSMVESAISATAAAQISPLVDWADIDGPFLTARDPFEGVTYAGGKLVLPEAPGLGVTEKAAVA